MSTVLLAAAVGFVMYLVGFSRGGREEFERWKNAVIPTVSSATFLAIFRRVSGERPQ